MKNLKEKLEDKDPERVRTFMKAASGVVKKILGQFDEYQFFTGESVRRSFLPSDGP